MAEKLILDACCGGRMFWFDKNHPNAIYCDNRREEKHLPHCGKTLNVNPDILADFKHLPFPDKTFRLVVFDPPHLLANHLGGASELAFCYGRLFEDWGTELRAGFDECWRVLKGEGVLIFKWSARDISLKKLLEAIGREPLFGNRSGKNTHWLCFMKDVTADELGDAV